uniref:Uncharacterized protein n=1 Tax=Triticum urartu TaxID=4572 RepID=A0A8R7U1U8_TRIUA
MRALKTMTSMSFSWFCFVVGEVLNYNYQCIFFLKDAVTCKARQIEAKTAGRSECAIFSI